MTILKRAVGLVVIGLFLSMGSSCKTNSGMITPNPPVVTDQDHCAAACANLQKLSCQEGDPIVTGTSCKVDQDCKDPDGNWDVYQQCSTVGHCMVSCVNFCITTENSGVWLDPGCVEKITSCDQVDSCPAPVAPKASFCEGGSFHRTDE